jgi:proteic killer suppression protein
MVIFFKTKKMDTEFNTEKLLVRNRGSERAKKIMLRKTQLENVDNMEQLRPLPGHYHALTGNRLGWYAVDLDGPYRLIFIPNETPLPELPVGGLDWSKVTNVTILGVLNYHEQTNKEPS